MTMTTIRRVEAVNSSDIKGLADVLFDVVDGGASVSFMHPFTHERAAAFWQKVAEGVKATVGLLESCHDESLFQADELKQALQRDHVRLVFPKPIAAKVTNKKIEFSELVFRLPLNTGVFWVRAGDMWRRYSKYEFQKEKSFAVWLKEAQPTQ